MSSEVNEKKDVVVDMPKDIAKMTEEQVSDLSELVLGRYATLDHLIELSTEPPCPHATMDQVVTDIPSQMWGTLLRRMGEILGIDDMVIKREPKAWRKDKSMGYYYRTDIWKATHAHISSLVAKKARMTRAPVRSDDISNDELARILEASGIVMNA